MGRIQFALSFPWKLMFAVVPPPGRAGPRSISEPPIVTRLTTHSLTHSLIYLLGTSSTQAPSTHVAWSPALVLMTGSSHGPCTSPPSLKPTPCGDASLP